MSELGIVASPAWWGGLLQVEATSTNVDARAVPPGGEADADGQGVGPEELLRDERLSGPPLEDHERVASAAAAARLATTVEAIPPRSAAPRAP